MTNDSTFEPVTLDALVDDVFGDLDSAGNCLADGSITLQPGETYGCRFTGAVTGTAGSTHTDTVTATARDHDPVPAVVTAEATAQVRIVALPISPLQPTDMLPAADELAPGGPSIAELLRLFTLFIAATILVGGLGIAVVCRTRA